MIKILFNCSTNIVGGGIKNSAMFIKNSIGNTDFDWYYAVSPQVYDLISKWEVTIDNQRLFVINDSPSKNLASRKSLKKMATDLGIDLVYTMAGPAYVKFPCKHIQGISNPYITHADWSSFKLKGNLLNVFKYYAHVFVQFLYVVKADYFIFQTNFAKNSFKKRSGISEKRLHVVPNAFDVTIKEYFSNHQGASKEESANNEIKIFCPGAGYIHKGFQFLPGIIKEMKKTTTQKFKFILTLPEESSLWHKIRHQLKKEGLDSFVENKGPYKYTEIISLLRGCDIVFVPSLLETFSASYLEAMCAKKTLVVADKIYAKEVCGDYAVYVDPQDAIGSAIAFSKLFDNLELTNEQAELAEKILSKYGSQEERFQNLLTVINKIAHKK